MGFLERIKCVCLSILTLQAGVVWKELSDRCPSMSDTPIATHSYYSPSYKELDLSGNCVGAIPEVDFCIAYSQDNGMQLAK